MAAARDKGRALRFQGYEYQLFTDLASSTIQEHKAMKPFFEILQQHRVDYRWGFLFAVLFSFNNRHYAMKTPKDLDNCRQALHLTPMGKQGGS